MRTHFSRSAWSRPFHVSCSVPLLTLLVTLLGSPLAGATSIVVGPDGLDGLMGSPGLPGEPGQPGGDANASDDLSLPANRASATGGRGGNGGAGGSAIFSPPGPLPAGGPGGRGGDAAAEAIHTLGTATSVSAEATGGAGGVGGAAGVSPKRPMELGAGGAGGDGGSARAAAATAVDSDAKLVVDARATGGAGQFGGRGGSVPLRFGPGGRGGDATVDRAAATSSGGGEVEVRALAQGGDGSGGGDGGEAAIRDVFGVSTSGPVSITASATGGGGGAMSSLGAGSGGRGGAASSRATGTSAGDGRVAVSASATGGRGGDGFRLRRGGAGGLGGSASQVFPVRGRGGDASASGDATNELGETLALVRAVGGDAGSLGDAGKASVQARGTSLGAAQPVTVGSQDPLESGAFGGTGGSTFLGAPTPGGSATSDSVGSSFGEGDVVVIDRATGGQGGGEAFDLNGPAAGGRADSRAMGIGTGRASVRVESIATGGEGGISGLPTGTANRRGPAGDAESIAIASGDAVTHASAVATTRNLGFAGGTPLPTPPREIHHPADPPMGGIVVNINPSPDDLPKTPTIPFDPDLGPFSPLVVVANRSAAVDLDMNPDSRLPFLDDGLPPTTPGRGPFLPLQLPPPTGTFFPPADPGSSGTARARARAIGESGDATARAEAGSLGESVVTATSRAPVSRASEVVVESRAAVSESADPLGDALDSQAATFVTGRPLAADVQTAVAESPIVEAALAGPGRVELLGLATLSAGSVDITRDGDFEERDIEDRHFEDDDFETDDTHALSLYTSQASLEFSDLALDPQSELIFGLLNPVGGEEDFESLRLELDVGSAPLLAREFNTAEAALAALDDVLVSLVDPGVPGDDTAPLAIDLMLSVETRQPHSGFALGVVVATVEPVPEPGTASLLVLALTWMLWRRARSERSARTRS